ncbi:hypothetical protein A6E15_18240 [Natrinema saccharevitans]|uniref:Pyrrolo-quinoline quinone repeat domain-containing protein n=1 Tax=Natrinema saccharevitans TaxID=301967 RepID=A0A1S8ARN0_9EURY|nr:PQQ-binding-like beta-propeller repeat protein [Natrinema saccharevitans]OLZ39330.1 hypothetical protein A6E15_18240 [Natrinema saccharevitans]
MVTERGVFVVDGNTLGIHDRQTGDRNSETRLFEPGETLSTTMAVDQRTAFVATDEELLAVDIETGTTRWRHDDGVYAQGFSVGSETVVAMVDGSENVSTELRETITAFDREAGDVRWNYALDGFHSEAIPPVLGAVPCSLRPAASAVWPHWETSIRTAKMSGSAGLTTKFTISSV